jgi:hypothetical protein
MLAIAPKDNLVRTFPSRVAVVIEPSRGSEWWTLFSFDDLVSFDGLAGRLEDMATGRTDQAD